MNALIDQERPVQLLKAILRKGTVPNTFLFTGIDGIGKRTAAINVAMACNCEGDMSAEISSRKDSVKYHDPPKRDEPCGTCRPCRKILSGNHPDIIFIESQSGSAIKIAQIRDLFRTLAMKPYEGRMRVVGITDAQTMTSEAANALLKALEEPPDKTLFILTATQPTDLLPTVVSRCRHIAFNPVSQDHIETYLVGKGVKPDEAVVISTLSNGSISKAMEIFDSISHKGSWLNWRNRLFQDIESLSSMPVASVLSFAENLSHNKAILSDAFEVMKLYFRDLLMAKYNPGKLINRDMDDAIRQRASRATVQSIFTKIEAVRTAQQRIDANMNLRLTLDIMALQIAGYPVNSGDI